MRKLPRVPIHELPADALIRQHQLVPAIIPLSPATLRRMVASGNFPQPVQLTKRVRAWRADDVRVWLATRETSAT